MKKEIVVTVEDSGTLVCDADWLKKLGVIDTQSWLIEFKQCLETIELTQETTDLIKKMREKGLIPNDIPPFYELSYVLKKYRVEELMLEELKNVK